MTEETAQSQTPEEAKSEKAEAKKPVKAGVIARFNEAIDIFPDSRMAEFDVGQVKAYRAVGKDKGGYNCFALVCEPHLVPRIRAASLYASIINPSIVPLMAAGIVYWPPANQERCVFIYRDALGKRVTKKGEAALGWRQDDVMNTVVKPLIGVLHDFRNKDFVHGAIRPSNMFFASQTGKSDKVILGDCLAVPASYEQSVLFEPIERAMAQPIGRGEGTAADDIYAFGVSLAIFMRANDPLEGKSDDEIVRAKLESGSYAAVTGKERFKGSILELLRGVLHDEASQRWTIEEIMTWLDGRRLSPKQLIKEKKAPRPITFNGKRYFQTSFLAMSMSSNPQETIHLVESGDMDQWLTRSLEEDETTERVEQAIKSSREKGTGPGYDERLAANLSSALDPRAPMRFRGLSLMGEGVGRALTETFVLKKDIQVFADLFSQSISLNWVTAQKAGNVDTGSLISRFDSCRNFIRQEKIGYGIERCVYLLCPEAQCLSEKLNGYFVKSPEDMLRAFEDMCQKGKAPTLFLDRHSAAFLSVKDSKVIDSYLYDLGAAEYYKKVLGNLRCLATIQKRGNFPPVPALSEHFSGILSAVCERYHDRDVRDKLEKNISRYAVEGDLVKMAGLLSNVDLVSKDMDAFRRAMIEHAQLSREYSTLELRLADKSTFGKATGREVAAVVSGVISGIVILFIAFMFFTKNQIF